MSDHGYSSDYAYGYRMGQDKATYDPQPDGWNVQAHANGLWDVCVDTSTDAEHVDDYETAEMWATKVSDMICALEDEGVEY